MADSATITSDGKLLTFTGVTTKQYESGSTSANLRDGSKLTQTYSITTPPTFTDTLGRVWTVTSVTATGFTAASPV